MKICITLKVCCIIAFIFFAIPFIINFLGCIHAPFQSWSEPSKWTMFWGQYISGFAAFAMLYVAWRTLLTTKETNRPYVIIDIVERCSIAYIRCRNIGHTTAQNIKLSFKMEQISEIAISEVKECFKSINSSSPFVLEPNGTRVWEVFCIPSHWLDCISDRPMETKRTYEFKGKRIPKEDWVNNETSFKSRNLNCTVSYDGYPKEDFVIDYNNRLYDYAPAELISDSIDGISRSLAYIRYSIDKIKEKYCDNEQTK